MARHSKNTKMAGGFTLIELLVVISIISLLSSVVLSAVNVAREKSRIVAGLQFGSILDHSIGNNAVVSFDFNECGGTTLSNSAVGNIGTVSGPVTWDSPPNIPAKSGCAINFPAGGSSYVSTPNSADYNIGYSKDLTISAWIKYTNISGYGGIVNYYAISSGHRGFGLMVLANGIRFEMTNSSGVQTGLQYPTLLNDGKWHHVAIVLVRSLGTMTLYVDGKATWMNTDLANAGTGVSLDPVSTTLATVGVNDPAWGGYFYGSIDTARMYTSSLTAGQIEKSYAEGLATHQNLATK